MGCFFLDHCCILGAPLPSGPLSSTIDRDRKLWQTRPTFSANQQSANLCESLSKSLSLTNSVFSSFVEEKKSKLHGTPNVLRTMKRRLFMLLWLSNLRGNLLGIHDLQRQLHLNSRVNCTRYSFSHLKIRVFLSDKFCLQAELWKEECWLAFKAGWGLPQGKVQPLHLWWFHTWMNQSFPNQVKIILKIYKINNEYLTHISKIIMRSRLCPMYCGRMIKISN